MLYDAFFRHQTKPKLSELGDLYYEGKEYEAHIENVSLEGVNIRFKSDHLQGWGAPNPMQQLLERQRFGLAPF